MTDADKLDLVIALLAANLGMIFMLTLLTSYYIGIVCGSIEALRAKLAGEK